MMLDVEPLHYSTASIVRRDQADEEATNNGSVCNFVDMVWILKACGISIPQRELASVYRLRGISLKSRMHWVWSAQRLPLQWVSSSAVVQHGSAAGGINTGSRLLWQQQIL
jgi:hypothetical protein